VTARRALPRLHRYLITVDVDGAFLEAAARLAPEDSPRAVMTDLLNEACVATQARAAAVRLMALQEPRLVETVSVGFGEGDPRLEDLLEPQQSPGSVPLLTTSVLLKGKNVGTLLLYDKAAGQDFTDDDTRLAELFAAQLALCATFIRQLAAQARRSHFFEMLVDHSPDQMMFFDRVNSIQYANEAARKRFLEFQLAPPLKGGFPVEAVPYHPDGRPFLENERPIARALNGETVENVEAEVRLPDGQRLVVSCNAAPARGDGGELLGAMLTFRDITAERELERLRAEFAAIMVHDLRNPLSALALMAQSLMRQANDDQVLAPVNVLTRIDHVSRRLTVMVGELLDASRIELGRLQLDPHTIDLPKAVGELVNDIAPTLGAHAVSIDVRGHPPPVNVDPARLNQILTNLLENSAKYSRDGGAIGVAIASEAGGSTVTVSDEGPGIVAEDLPRLFDRFFQAQRARERRAGGLGLGLYITKGLVEASGGHIRAQSESGHGTAFEVWLPEVRAAQ
jgi:signal transduction histidine kinase